MSRLGRILNRSKYLDAPAPQSETHPKGGALPSPMLYPGKRALLFNGQAAGLGWPRETRPKSRRCTLDPELRRAILREPFLAPRLSDEGNVERRDRSRKRELVRVLRQLHAKR